MRKIGKAVTVVALLSALCGLFGCDKTPEYTVEDIRSVSISCGHMDYSHSYAFYLRKEENGWLLDAEFATDTEQSRVEYEACPVAQEDVRALLNIVQEQDVIGKLRRYKKPKIGVQVLDETTYYTSLLFADGESIGAASHVDSALESGFYRLAEKYADTIPETDHTQTDTEEEQGYG